MLDILSNLDSSTRTMMPVDLAPYLLSASPPRPGFNFHNFSFNFPSSPKLSLFTHRNRSSPKPRTSKQEYDSDCAFPGQQKVFLKSIMHNGNVKKESISLTSEQSSSTSTCSESFSGENARCPKRVSFADSSGLPLAEIRVMVESSSEPPKFTDERLSALRRELCPEESSSDDILWQPLRVTFPQPVGDFSTFSQKLKNNMICLESASTEGYTVEGMIMVRQNAFQKRLFVRYTIDSWESYTDIEVEFLPDVVRYEHDTYKFQFKVPSASDCSKSVEFAVCAEVDGTQHWDNNDGANYIIAWEPKPEYLQEDDRPTNQNNAVALDELVLWYDDDMVTPPYY